MSAAITLPPTALDVAAVRAQFPILQRTVHGKPLVYLDNAASVQKPQAVIDSISGCYQQYYANVHRGVHALSEQSTAAYEGARETVRQFLNAASTQEIIFTRGTTEAINLVAASFARPRLQPDDEIVISAIEHHSNIVPWQMVCQQTGAKLRVIPVLDNGELDQQAFVALLNERTRLLGLIHVSNALGTVNPVRPMIAQAHARGIPVLLDGAQAAPHFPLDVQALDCDFYAFSGHKTYGPSGIGVLYGKAELLNAMPPWQGGGDMIRSVTFEHTEYAPLPYKFEAGTPHIAGAIGLAAALDWMRSTGIQAIADHEQDLLEYATAQFRQIPGVRIIGQAAEKSGALSFLLDGVHPHDIATVFDQSGVAIRAGHHCAQPVMNRFGVPATARASVAAYNTREDIDTLVSAVYHVKELFG